MDIAWKKNKDIPPESKSKMESIGAEVQSYGPKWFDLDKTDS